MCQLPFVYRPLSTKIPSAYGLTFLKTLLKNAAQAPYFNPNPHCLRIKKAFFVKMKKSPGWLKQNIFF
jgi:hypothetical protein